MPFVNLGNSDDNPEPPLPSDYISIFNIVNPNNSIDENPSSTDESSSDSSDEEISQADLAMRFQILGLLANSFNGILPNFSPVLVDSDIHLVSNFGDQEPPVSFRFPLENLINLLHAVVMTRYQTAPLVGERPVPGVNASRIDALNMTDEIPSEFICPLSSEVMTNPAHDPRTPDVNCERAQFEFSLAQKPENPFTRQPLRPDELIVNETLKGKIEEFIAKLENPPMPVVYRRNMIRESEVNRLLIEAEAYIGPQTLQPRNRHR